MTAAAARSESSTSPRARSPSYALPSGLWLPSSGWRIAAGPSVPATDGTGEVFFTGTTAPSGSGNAAIGEVSEIPFPVAPGALAFKNAVNVSKQHLAVLTLTCSGQSNAGCAGKIQLSVKAKVRVKVQVRSARKGASARYRTLTQTKRLSLASISYSARGGQSLHSTVKLSNAAYLLLEKVEGHRWNATVSSTTTLGTVSGTQLTMTGPTPPKPKPQAKAQAQGQAPDEVAWPAVQQQELEALVERALAEDVGTGDVTTAGDRRPRARTRSARITQKAPGRRLRPGRGGRRLPRGRPGRRRSARPDRRACGARTDRCSRSRARPPGCWRPSGPRSTSCSSCPASPR